jgi:LacI family transcriptional regulator
MADRKSKNSQNSMTMYKIARLAGVSQSTVSRVMNGKTPVSPDKRMAVLAMVEQLNYQPNGAAQELVSGKTAIVGVLARHICSPYFADMLRGIARGLQRTKRYFPVIDVGDEPAQSSMSALESLRARRVGGLILQAGNELSDDYLRDLAGQTPLIIIGRIVPGLEKQCMVIDNVLGGYIATSYLISQGHTRIAHIGGRPDSLDAAPREQGYRQALIDHGLTPDPALIVPGDYSEEGGMIAARKLLPLWQQARFSAIFAANDQTAIGARLALYQEQIAVPEAISFVGFDDWLGARYMTPPLTTVRQPAYDMGLIAAQAMGSMLDGAVYTIPDIPLELVVRQSVASR